MKTIAASVATAVSALAIGLAAAPRAAHAHGTIPTSNSISFGPGAGGVLLGTNFGGIFSGGPEVDLRFLCERGVTGEQTSVDVWQWLKGGAIAGVVTTGGFIRGVYLSEPGGCGFAVVSGSDDMLMTDVAPDPESDSGFYAVGATTGDDAEARLVRRSAGGVETLSSLAGATATAVRAAGAHVYTVFLTATDMVLVHRPGKSSAEDRWTVARDGTEVLRPLGVDPATPTTLWLVKSTDAEDVLLRSEDGGEHTTPVLTLNARIGGFAIDGASVWIQSARNGIYASTDGGKEFAPMAGSPHGTCLGLDAQKRLYACGVPWQDGMALGVRDDESGDFVAVIPYYDGIVGALACASYPEVTTTCDEELAFLRDYYGFSSPDVSEGDTAPEAVESSPEPTPEGVVEELGDGDTSSGNDTTTTPESDKKGDDGCNCAAASTTSDRLASSGPMLLALLALAGRAWMRRRARA